MINPAGLGTLRCPLVTRPPSRGRVLGPARARHAVLLESRLLEHQRRAADAAALEAPDREVETHRGRTVVELDDRAVVAGKVARADPWTDADAISDAQSR